MTYRVTFTSKAKREFNEAAVWWAENRSVEQAAQWLDDLEVAVLALAEDPERHWLERTSNSHFLFMSCSSELAPSRRTEFSTGSATVK